VVDRERHGIGFFISRTWTMERLDVNNEEEKRSVAVVLLAAVSGRRYGRQTVPNRVCKQCTKPFYHRPRGKSRMNPGTFCSRACAIASRKGRVPKSMCSGIEAAAASTAAWHPLGWRPGVLRGDRAVPLRRAGAPLPAASRTSAT
jgi:hypothetical protein